MFWNFTRTNPLAAIPLSGLIGLLVLLLSPGLFAGSAPAASGAIVRIENLTKLPGTNRGFPAENYFTLHRSDRERNSVGQAMRYTDRSKMRIHNDGSGTLTITKLTTTNTSNFRINGAPSGSFQIAPKSFRDVEVLFLTSGGQTRRLVTESLVMESNADNASSVRATFRGAYMQYIEGGSEINAQQVMDAFGFKTRMGVDDNGNLQVRPSSFYPSDSRVNSGLEGDLILAGIYEQADPNKPVQTIQMAAFHGPGGSSTEFRDEASERRVGGMNHNHGDLYHQTLLPRLLNDSRDPAGDFTATTGQPFQIILAGYRSTGGNKANERKNELLAIRTYKVVDGSGRVVPNEYIVLMDYVGNGCGAGNNNCDWNDNVAYVTNVRPRAKPTAKSISDIVAEVSTRKSVNVSGSFSRGYPGNQLTYSARLSGGGSVPSWVTINSATGVVSINAPSSASGRDYRIEVTATDLNRIQVRSTVTLNVIGDSAPDEPAPPAGEGHYWLEAECAQVGANWKLNSGSVTAERTSMSSPPSDVAANRIRFVFEVDRSGSYKLFARIKARDGNTDSYWVRTNGGSWYKWSSGIDQSGNFAWNRLPPGVTLRTGSNTIDFAYRESGAELDKLYITSTSTAPSGAGSQGTNCAATPSNSIYWLEAECAQVGSRWQRQSTGSASGSQYVVVSGRNSTSAAPADEAANRVRFTLIGASSGNYRLWARIDAPSGLDDSFWVRVNGGAWYRWYRGIEQGKGFTWNQLPLTLPLREGANTVDFAYREDGTRLDKLFLTKGTTIPTGLGNPASNCSAQVAQAGVASVEAEAAFDDASAAPELSLFPNPVSDRLQVQLRDAFTGTVNVVLTDVHGRRVSILSYEKPAERLQLELDVTDLPAGLYHLQTIAGDRRTVRSFVKR
ncbi:hypothetical protein LEM8419_00598 [Neolewinella maritima]|uniref:Dystroglycan-type cadherin-like domain-containing protein n=1 Tax=Neolewinella maritima TaxID=1383882 RepID=A0ABN8F5A3_9BACT|nr:putative Ig domain-containing protein [Neolewinella maritima]CAH0999300.1 hypothetical protein LEM8419_00598 [Neolewinella maritima]